MPDEPTSLSPLLLSHDAVQWLQRLARAHEAGDGWVSWQDAALPECFRPLEWLGLVEWDDAISARLTEFGMWALANAIENVGTADA